MRHGSLFSGIGGFDLAAEWMGWDNVFSCEIDPFCQQVLQHHWPNVDHHTDIFDFNATQYFGRIDVLTGGFPCQPFSCAGKQQARKDERYLFPEMCRIVRECRPAYVVAENVRGLLNLGGGVEFIAVCDELESCGYELQTFCVPAAGKGAPHKRERIFIVAHTDGAPTKHEVSAGRDVSASDAASVAHAQRLRLEHGTQTRDVAGVQGKKGGRGSGSAHAAETDGHHGDVANPHGTVLEYGNGKRKAAGPTIEKIRTEPPCITGTWETFPTQSPVCDGNDGVSLELDGITFPKWRKETLKAMGNAIVPQVAFEIFKAIERHETKF